MSWRMKQKSCTAQWAAATERPSNQVTPMGRGLEGGAGGSWASDWGQNRGIRPTCGNEQLPVRRRGEWANDCEAQRSTVKLEGNGREENKDWISLPYRNWLGRRKCFWPRDPQIFPAEFSSNPDQTHLSMLISVFRIFRQSQGGEFDQGWS